jgi:Fe-S-cluster containining protein
MSKCAQVDCEAGRALGCQTFCCRLLVRLDADEHEAATGSGKSPRFIEKCADGYCVHLDRETHLCRIWARRSSVCRRYDCNSDFLLQVAVRHRFKNIAELARIASCAYIPKETYIQVPYAKK